MKTYCFFMSTDMALPPARGGCPKMKPQVMAMSMETRASTRDGDAKDSRFAGLGDASGAENFLGSSGGSSCPIFICKYTKSSGKH